MNYKITAMLRVKNEADFIYQSILSLENIIDKIILIDNKSDDDTKLKANDAASKINVPIMTFDYMHDIAKMGSENKNLYIKDPNSPKLLSNFYNWCLEKIETELVLKWDGDMIAIPNTFHEAFEKVRSGKKNVCAFRGINMLPNNKVISCNENEFYLIAQKLGYQYKDLAAIRSNWLDSYTDFEPRLFLKKGAFFDNKFWWCEHLSLPMNRIQRFIKTEKVNSPSYKHMKMCKNDAFANMSHEIKKIVESSITPIDINSVIK